jgi:hypothetical protein
MVRPKRILFRLLLLRLVISNHHHHHHRPTTRRRQRQKAARAAAAAIRKRRALLIGPVPPRDRHCQIVAVTATVNEIEIVVIIAAAVVL